MANVKRQRWMNFFLRIRGASVSFLKLSIIPTATHAFWRLNFQAWHPRTALPSCALLQIREGNPDGGPKGGYDVAVVYSVLRLYITRVSVILLSLGYHW